MQCYNYDYMVDDIRDKRSPRKRDDEEEVIVEPSFVPPEDLVEADDEVIDMGSITSKTAEVTKNPKNFKKPGKLKSLLLDIKYWFNKRSKKQKIAIILLLIATLAASSFGIYKILAKSPPAPAPVVVEQVKEPPKPTTKASRLTGVEIPIELDELPVTGIMIENSPDARPQSGLTDAGMVFEAVAEGGITRFLALYLESKPDFVGPVRSVRPYYLSWLQGFDAGVAHAGGSAVALEKIRNEGIKDLDQFSNTGPYQRVSGRYAPHNLYTSLNALIELQKSKGFTSSKFTSFPRKLDTPITPTTAKSVDIKISSTLYNTHYDYDAATNSYLRVLAGKPHIDERSGKQINPKVVIALVLSQGREGVHTTYNTVGSGRAFIFQDGGVTVGTWSKASDKEQLLIGDANGAPLGLNAGQTWLTAVGAENKVVYLP